MDINDNIESPLILKVSFNKYLNQFQRLINADNDFIAANARRILKIADDNPVLRDGFSDTSLFKTYETEIESLLQDAFSPLLTNNEIKTASVPFHDLIFNSSERFKSILKTAGEGFELQIKNMPVDQRYIIACTIILNFCYGYNLNFKRPFFYEIPDANGIMRYYKILYNADFTEIVPKKNVPKITDEDYHQLLDNFENIDLWKEKFPPNSYEFKGFVISNIFDVTDDQSISNIKSTLIGEDKRKDESFMENFHEIFRSLLGLKDIKVGFSIYNEDEDTFERVYGTGMNSFLLNELETAECSDSLCSWSYNRLLKEKKYFSVSDVELMYKRSEDQAPHVRVLHEQGIQSAIFAPIANDQGLMGILEIVSEEPKVLNSINANKLVDVMPFIVSAVERSKNEEENLIEAIIQQECTSIHSSVHWRFEKEARNFIKDQLNGLEPNFNKIAFDNVYPLYGQIDIKGSSEARNSATQKDLTLQLKKIEKIIKEASKSDSLPIYEQYRYQLKRFLEDLKNNFQVDSEQRISAYIKEDIEPVLKHLHTDENLKAQIDDYFKAIDLQTNAIYYHRKDYDDTISIINREMASVLDTKQLEAQDMYPHYYERYKTDGVEHNMYIGESITKENSFNPIYLYNLRLWQLQIMCEMENTYYQMQTQSKFPVHLDVASMILVFSQPLSISFRMDEKQFDVDGTYNARYEIVKKRVDKAFIKGTNERITQKGKITIVYSQKEDEREYLRYVRFLQSKHYLDTDVEILELQDLQAVTGLKAIRVSVLYHKEDNDKAYYTYDDLMKEISA
ncbi:GAF domain-containing protein [Winogradskyella sp. PC-19]|uniref:GAF domain-containing protein n=1 Tax=unclassified Winogradskyella TaxID=2615021 RepID=UPI000B3BED2F|nr:MULTISPECIES: GAF domain-containing protein [unclassified Winogradskyella]ARV10082.1 GAF domain-containing protein [Winogradskyella sp. PC-19]RZN76277.1 MAG: GAF domain-containing protein [Winogradskyella sp.]